MSFLLKKWHVEHKMFIDFKWGSADWRTKETFLCKATFSHPFSQENKYLTEVKDDPSLKKQCNFYHLHTPMLQSDYGGS